MKRADILTLSRAIALPIIIVLLALNQTYTILFGLLLLILALITDFLDGYYARIDGPSNLGKIMDPLVDKILVLSLLALYLKRGELDLWMYLVFLLRELGMTAVRHIASSQGKTIAANWAGKLKTNTQFFLLLLLIVQQLVPSMITILLADIMAYIAVVATAASFALYLYRWLT